MSYKPENNHDDIVWHRALIKPEDREKFNQHDGVIIWFTGLSGSGKSTLAHAVEERLFNKQCHTFVLDGDNIRHGLCADLGFSDQDRQENIRRIGELAKLFMQAGTIVLTAFISPFMSDRQKVKAMVDNHQFIEIYCAAPVEVCESRDCKGLYKKARAGEITDFTGISSPYEAPLNPDIVLNTGEQSLEDCVDYIVAAIEKRGIIKTMNKAVE